MQKVDVGWDSHSLLVIVVDALLIWISASPIIVTVTTNMGQKIRDRDPRSNRGSFVEIGRGRWEYEMDADTERVESILQLKYFLFGRSVIHERWILFYFTIYY